MTEPANNAAQCSCTQDSDCERCKKLENIGYGFMEAGGYIDVALLVQECVQLRGEIEQLRKENKTAWKLLNTAGNANLTPKEVIQKDREKIQEAYDCEAMMCQECKARLRDWLEAKDD